MRFTNTGLRATMLVAGILALASTAQADRRTGMYGNLLITDQDDLFLFPQETMRYKNRISLDYGAAGPGEASGRGNGLFTMGDDGLAFGVAIHRGDVLIPAAAYFDGPIGAQLPNFALDDPASPLPVAFVQPATMVDLLLALDSGLGLRLAFGPSVDSSEASGTQSGDSEFFLLAGVGFGTGVRGEGDGRYDFSGSIIFDTASKVAAGTDVASGGMFALSGLFRGFLPMDDTMDLGLLGAVGISNVGVSNDAADPSEAASTTVFALTGGAGPSFRFGKASVAAYGTLAFDFASIEPNDQVDDDETKSMSIVIPGVNVAVEVPLTDWFFVRTGADYRWMSASTADQNENSAAAITSQFGWNAGAGVKVGNFTFDGAIQHGFVTNGPDFIGGDPGGFLTMANLTYDFDDARSGVVPVEQPVDEAAEEEVIAEAPPAPAPAPLEGAPAPAPAPLEGAPAPAGIEPAPAPVAPLPLPAAPPGGQ